MSSGLDDLQVERVHLLREAEQEIPAMEKRRRRSGPAERARFDRTIERLEQPKREIEQEQERQRTAAGACASDAPRRRLTPSEARGIQDGLHAAPRATGDDVYRTAIHEAGHAVVPHLEGAGLRGVRLHPSERGGRLQFSGGTVLCTGAGSVAISVAGYAAERQMGSTPDPATWAGDRARAMELLRAHEYPARRMHEEARRVQTILALRWSVVELLACEFVDKIELDGPEPSGSSAARWRVATRRPRGSAPCRHGKPSGTESWGRVCRAVLRRPPPARCSRASRPAAPSTPRRRGSACTKLTGRS